MLGGSARPRIAGFFLVVSLSLFAMALVYSSQAILGDASGHMLLVDQSPQSVGDLPPGKTVPLTVTVKNRSFSPVRLVGSDDVCAAWGCLVGKGFPMDVGAMSTREVRIELRTAHRKFSGEFSGEIILYSDYPGKERIPVRVMGRIIESQQAAKASPSGSVPPI